MKTQILKHVKENIMEESDGALHLSNNSVLRKSTCHICDIIFHTEDSVKEGILSHSKKKVHEYPIYEILFSQRYQL